MEAASDPPYVPPPAPSASQLADEARKTGLVPASDTDTNAITSKRNSKSKSGSARVDVWQNPLDFLMSMVAYAVSLGNVWRFPYLAFRHGGGTFLFAYAIFFVFLALPMFLMEATLGQYLGRGAMEVWRVFPIFKGVGFGNLMICFSTVVYFPVLISYALFYLFNSFSHPFPWESCNNYWNDNTTCVETSGEIVNASDVFETATKHRRVLHESDGFFAFGGVQWELAGIMVGVWLVVYFCIWRGLINARFFVWFSALSPYVSLFALLIRGLMLEGASKGIAVYLKPNISRLTDVLLWKDASSQVFYSYGIGFGTISSLGAYNQFNHNVIRDSILVCFINGGTSIIAGFAIFATLGHLAFKMNKNVEDVATQGTGLAFEVYPEAVSRIPWPRLWAVLFFFMIFFLGLNSQVCMTEALYTSFEDSFPRLLRVHKKKCMVVLCVFVYLLSFVMVTHAGTYWLKLVDNYGAAGYSLLLISLFEVVGMSWGFGAEKIVRGLEEMRGIRLTWIFVLLWKYVGPLIILTILIVNVVQYTRIKETLKLNIDVPMSMELFSVVLSLSSVIFVPVYVIYYLLSKPDTMTFKQRLGQGTKTPADVNRDRVTRFSVAPPIEKPVPPPPPPQSSAVDGKATAETAPVALGGEDGGKRPDSAQ